MNTIIQQSGAGHWHELFMTLLAFKILPLMGALTHHATSENDPQRPIGCHKTVQAT